MSQVRNTWPGACCLAGTLAFAAGLSAQSLIEPSSPGSRNASEVAGSAIAEIEFLSLTLNGCDLRVDLAVRHPARELVPAPDASRAWIEFVVRDGDGIELFHSGRPRADGGIEGNDQDDEGDGFESHHAVITSGDQVQIYEAILDSVARGPTSGPERPGMVLKDNRLSAARRDQAIRGRAMHDQDFGADGDVVVYAVDLAGSVGPYEVEAVLHYQPVGYRWAQSLRDVSSTPLARASRTVD